MLILPNIVEKNRISNSKYKNIKKSRNKIVQILAKSKSQNLLKFRSKNLFIFKKVQSAIAIEGLDFFTSNVRVVFTKLR